MRYEISPARYEDVKAIAELARQSGELHQKKEPTYFRKCALSNNAEYIKKVIDDEYAEVFKACDENKKVVGYLTLYLHDCSKEFFVYPDFGYVGDLCVDEHYRRQGIAQLPWAERMAGAAELVTLSATDCFAKLTLQHHALQYYNSYE